MFTLWSDLDRAFFGNRWATNRPSTRSLTRHLEELIEERRPRVGRMNLIDKGEDLLFIAELPGVNEKDIEATVHKEVLTIRAERSLNNGEGRAHRQERKAYEFQRSISLPAPVDPDRIQAKMKDGVLRIKMAKAPEHKPRQITVNAE